MVKRRHLFNGKNGIKMLRIGGISMLLGISSTTAFAHLAKDATTYASYWQEQITVRGTVKDISSGQPLAGVTVTVKGTNQATTTDDQGNYELEGVPGSATLVFSSIGMESREVAVSNQTTVNIELTATSDNIDEVVVVGYGTQKKATVTGAVSAVKGDELKKSPTVNLSNTIAGRVAGVTAVNRSGEPGGDGSGIRIRGTNTLGDSSPLIVIDGVPARAGGFERLNPADIENISVLKDASAAIYGARAANGVVLVTTKRGKTGKPTLSYTFNQGYSQPTVIPELADARQYAEMRNELEIFKLPVEEWKAALDAFNSTGSYTKANGDVLNAPFTQEDMQKFADGSDPWGHPNTDWYKETLKNWSPQSKHNLQLDGGSEDFRYLMSLGYLNQDGYYKNSANGYKQYDVRLNLDANVNKYVKLQFGMMGRQEDRNYPTKSAATIFRMTMRGNPTMPAYWPNGMPGPDIENGENPVVISTDASGYDRNKRYYFQTNGQIDIQIPGVEGLKVTGTAAVDKFLRNNKKWETPWFLYTWQNEYEDDGVTPKLVQGKRGPADPRLTQGNEDQLNVLLGAVVNYDKVIGDHTFNILAGVNRETIRNDNFTAFRRFFISNDIDYLFAGGDAEKDNGGGAWERARLNYFGRANYNYKGK